LTVLRALKRTLVELRKLLQISPRAEQAVGTSRPPREPDALLALPTACVLAADSCNTLPQVSDTGDRCRVALERNTCLANKCIFLPFLHLEKLYFSKVCANLKTNQLHITAYLTVQGVEHCKQLLRCRDALLVWQLRPEYKP